MSEANIADAVCATSYGRHRTIASLHLGFQDPDLSAGDTLAIQLAGLMLTEHLMTFAAPPGGDEVKLTDRERDAVAWAAEGKSDWEISVILGVSESTIRCHVDNARKKPGAARMPERDSLKWIPVQAPVTLQTYENEPVDPFQIIPSGTDRLYEFRIGAPCARPDRILGTGVRGAVLGFLLAMAAAGVARAGDYVVVSSTDPSLRPGEELDGGQRVTLGVGKTATLIHAAGNVTVLRGGASGARVPEHQAAGAGVSRMAALKSLIVPPVEGLTFGGLRSAPPVKGLTFGGVRSAGPQFGVCPEAATLRTLDEILTVQAAGCSDPARQALEAYVARSTSP